MHSSLTQPYLLFRYRQLHSRIFVISWLFLMLVTKPKMERELLHLGMFWLGYLFVIIGVLGRIYCSIYLGGYKNKVLICEGPFSIVRNPLYVFSFTASIGVSLQSEMLIMPVMLCCVFCWYYPKVVAKEETFLVHTFGNSYQTYIAKVPRWIPKFQLWNEPCTTESKPVFIRQTLMDAAVFFIPMPFFALIHMLHAHAILPVWFSVP